MVNNYWKNKKVAVTGVSGFIGSHFVEELNNLGASVTSFYHSENKTISLLKATYPQNIFVRLDLLDRNKVVKSMKKLDVLINCAAIDGNIEFKNSHPAQIFDTNIQIVQNILAATTLNSIPNLVNMSSAEVYPTSANSPIKEKDDYRLDFDAVENGYVLSKRFGELLCSMYSAQFGCHILMPRPTNVYGPRDEWGRSSRVVPNIVHSALKDRGIVLWGDGKQVRQFIYVKDLVCITLELLRLRVNGPVNLASDQTTTIFKLAKTILKLTNSHSKIEFDLSKSKTVGVKKRILDTTKLKSYTKNYLFTSIEKGLSQEINWCKLQV